MVIKQKEGDLDFFVQTTKGIYILNFFLSLTITTWVVTIMKFRKWSIVYLFFVGVLLFILVYRVIEFLLTGKSLHLFIVGTIETGKKALYFFTLNVIFILIILFLIFRAVPK